MSAIATILLVSLWLGSLLMVLPQALWRIRSQGWQGPTLSLLVMLILWEMSVPNVPGLPVHLLGVTAAALICGPSLAYYQVSVLGAVLAVFDPAATVADTAAYVLLGGALPAFITALGLQLARRHLPPNVFVFIFVNGCVTAAIGMVGFVVFRELLLRSEASLTRAVELSILLPLPEAILCGMIIAPLVAFRSRLVACFDANRYYGPGIS